MTTSGNCWWLGINNFASRRGTRRVVLYPEISPFLTGLAPNFDWPTRGGRKQCYQQMRPGDRTLLWTGHNPHGEVQWGILGTAEIATVTAGSIRLVNPNRFALPLTPHEAGATVSSSSRTPTSEFLWETFGPDFEPLFDVYSRLCYFPTPQNRILTIYDVAEGAFDAVVGRSHRRAA